MGRAPHLLHVFSTFVPAGPEVRTVRLMNALGPAWRHSVLAMDGRTEAREGLDPELGVRVLEALPRAGSLDTTRALTELLRREDPDLVCTYNWGAFDAVMASRWLGRGRHHLHHEDGFNADEAENYPATDEKIDPLPTAKPLEEMEALEESGQLPSYP